MNKESYEEVMIELNNFIKKIEQISFNNKSELEKICLDISLYESKFENYRYQKIGFFRKYFSFNKLRFRLAYNLYSQILYQIILYKNINKINEKIIQLKGLK
jgi:hypothetical protein